MGRIMREKTIEELNQLQDDFAKLKTASLKVFGDPQGHLITQGAIELGCQCRIFLCTLNAFLTNNGKSEITTTFTSKFQAENEKNGGYQEHEMLVHFDRVKYKKDALAAIEIITKSASTRMHEILTELDAQESAERNEREHPLKSTTEKMDKLIQSNVDLQKKVDSLERKLTKSPPTKKTTESSHGEGSERLFDSRRGRGKKNQGEKQKRAKSLPPPDLNKNS
jgi:hypothetical protein